MGKPYVVSAKRIRALEKKHKRPGHTFRKQEIYEKAELAWEQYCLEQKAKRKSIITTAIEAAFNERHR